MLVFNNNNNNNRDNIKHFIKVKVKVSEIYAVLEDLNSIAEYPNNDKIR